MTYDEFRAKLQNPDNKIAVVDSSDEVMYNNKKSHRNFTFNVLNEVIMSVPIVFYLQKNSYLTEIFNEKIDALKSAGLIDHWISKYLELKYLTLKREKKAAAKLSLKELFGAFQLLVFGAFCASLTFIVEITFKQIANLLKKLTRSNLY